MQNYKPWLPEIYDNSMGETNVEQLVIHCCNPPMHIIATSYNQNLYFYNDFKRYVLYLEEVLKDNNSISQDKQVTICYIGAASNDNCIYYQTFRFLLWWFKSSWNVQVITIKEIIDDKVDDKLFVSDIIFIDGGNTAVMLKLFNETNFDKKIFAAYSRGKILGGVSAGLLCWFKEGITDSFGDLRVLKCMNLIKYSCTPHYSGERKKKFKELIESGELSSGYGVPDGSIVHFINGEIYKSISMRDTIKFID